MGAKYPDLFKAFSGLSAITEFNQLSSFYENGNIEDISQNVISQPAVLATILANKGTLRPFMFDCGNDDILADANHKLHLDLEKNNISHIYNQYPGEHNWDYWTNHIKEHLLFFNTLL
jgi:S-formylglutathione hydrolase FrmB